MKNWVSISFNMVARATKEKRLTIAAAVTSRYRYNSTATVISNNETTPNSLLYSSELDQTSHGRIESLLMAALILSSVIILWPS